VRGQKKKEERRKEDEQREKMTSDALFFSLKLISKVQKKFNFNL